MFTKVSQLINWCFEPSQPLGIILGLKGTFIKRHKVERTNKAEIRPEEQSQKKETPVTNIAMSSLLSTLLDSARDNRTNCI